MAQTKIRQGAWDLLFGVAEFLVHPTGRHHKVALEGGEVMEDSEMYNTPITLASHANRHNESLLRY